MSKKLTSELFVVRDLLVNGIAKNDRDKLKQALNALTPAIRKVERMETEMEAAQELLQEVTSTQNNTIKNLEGLLPELTDVKVSWEEHTPPENEQVTKPSRRKIKRRNP